MDPWLYWRDILGSPKTVLAPMVDASELAYRLLCRKYGCDLAFTPMYHSGLFSKLTGYRNTNFQTCDDDKPLILQFCGNNPEIILQASKHIDDKVQGIDLNFGCPQNIAKRGHYGAFLLEESELMESLVSKLANSDLKCPISCKIRLVCKNDLQKTINTIYRLEQAGISMLTVHGRTLKNKGTLTGSCDWESLKIMKQKCNVPFIANGGIHTFDDIQKCLDFTGADAVMSAEAILEDPWLFSRFKNKNINRPSQFDLVDEYIDICKKYPPPNNSIVRSHLYRIFHTILNIPGASRFRDKINVAKDLSDFKIFNEELRNFFINFQNKFHKDIPQVGFWYIRHRIDRLEKQVSRDLILLYRQENIPLPKTLQQETQRCENKQNDDQGISMNNPLFSSMLQSTLLSHM
ncbi:dihydrouridine synthase family protein [Cryptosporidium serpentis]